MTSQRPDILMREAVRSDLEDIVGLLVDDALGQTREDASRPLNNRYIEAFEMMQADPNAYLIVACRNDEVIGTLHLNVIVGLSFLGMKRGQIESVRIADTARGQGLGQLMLEDAIRRCRMLGCGMVQLTMNATREDARRFYEKLGFSASHTGFKMMLDQPS